MSVMSRLPCPQCAYSWALWEYGKDQDRLFCPRCGYEEHTTADGTRVPMKGYGAYRIAYHAAPDEVGAWHKPLGPETVSQFKEALTRQGVDPARSGLTRWDETSGKVVALVGQITYLTL